MRAQAVAFPSRLVEVLWLVALSGRFGARGPDYFQVDLRAGWRRRIQERTIELFVDVFNLTNRTNWDNPLVANSDERLPNTFLTLTNLRGGSGFPRSVQFGSRIAF